MNRLKFIVVSTLFFFHLTSLQSQTVPCEDLGITTSLGFTTEIIPQPVFPGDDFCVQFSVENFNSVIGFQFTMTFDPNQLQFLSWQETPGTLIGPLAANDTRANEGILVFIWSNFNAEGQTLPDGTQVFTLCFRSIGDPADCEPLFLNNALSPAFPSVEVNYQPNQFENCKDSIITIDGQEFACVEVFCNELSIIDLGWCNSNVGMASIDFEICGGTAPYNYTLSNNVANLIMGTIDSEFTGLTTPLNNLPAQNYTLTVTDAMGAITSVPILIDAIPPISFDPPVLVDPVCAEVSTGSITVSNIMSGIPGELFDISFSLGNSLQDVDNFSFTGLGNGDYMITIEDMNGCEVVIDETLFTPPLELDIQTDPATCLGATDGALSVTATGGTPFPNDEYEYNGFLMESFETLTPFQDGAFSNVTNLYRMRVVDSNGCSANENIEIPVLQDIAAEFTDVTNIICKGECNASLTLNVLSTGNYTFLVRDPDNNFFGGGANTGQALIFTEELCAGTYSVQIRDNNGCEKDTFFTITEPLDTLMVDPGFSSADCNADNGSAFISISGGATPYDIQWEDFPGNTNTVITNLFPGTYNVTVTDNLGCVRDTFVNVMSGDSLAVEAFVETNLACDGTGTGTLNVNILESSSMNLSYQWSELSGTPLGATQTQSFTMPGSYVVEVMSNDNSCVALDTIEIPAQPGLSFEINTTEASCSASQDGTAEIINIQGGQAPYDCIWEDTSITSCNPTSLSQGTYNLTITDSNGCTKDTFVEILSLDLELTVDFRVVNVSCPEAADGTAEVININGGTGPYTCQWEVPATDCTATNLDAGTYNVTIEDVNGCSLDTFVVITRPADVIQYDLIITNASCDGDPGSIEVDNVDGAHLPITFTWDIPGVMGPRAEDLDVGSYTISFLDARGCMEDTTVNIIREDGDFMLQIDATPPDCAFGLDNGTITFPNFDGTTGTCEWSDPTLNAQNCTLIGLSPGIYNVTLTDASGCQKDTFIDLTVTEVLEIEVDNIMDVSCFEFADGQATVNVTNDPLNAGDYNFFWSNPADDDSGLSDDASQLSAGENFVFAFNGLCTSDTLFFDVNQPNEIALDINNLVFEDANCFGECNGEANLAATGGTSATGTYTYTWDDGFVGDFRNDLCAGSYIVTITDDNNCEITESLLISEPDELTLRVDSMNVVGLSCGSDMNGVITVIAEGGCGSFTYEWSDMVSDSDIATGLNAGTYSVTVTDACGCTAETSYTLESSTEINATALSPDRPLCAGDQVCIGIESASGGTGTNFTFSINFGARVPIDSCVMVDPGMYTLLVFDSAGCSSSLSVEVEQPDEFNVDIGNDIILDLGETNAEVTANVTGGSPQFDYAWNADFEINCIDPTCQSVSIMPVSFSTLEVQVTDANGCIARDQLNIEIQASRNVFIPNTFNPSDLPPNDKFMLFTGPGVEQLNALRIYDRWGNLMYERFNLPAPTNVDDGWDGRRGTGPNSDVVPGVYVYTAEVLFVDGVTIQYSGQLTLIK